MAAKARFDRFTGVFSCIEKLDCRKMAGIYKYNFGWTHFRM